MKTLCTFILLGYLATVSAQEPAEILTKHYDAMGQELWQQVTDVTIEGRWVDENYRGHAIKLSYKTPGKIRVEGNYEHQNFVEASNGVVFWIMAPWKDEYRPVLMNKQETLILQNSFHPGSPLYAIENQLKFGGLQDQEGELYLTFIFENPLIRRTFYIDRKDYRLYYESFESTENAFDPILKVYEKYKTYSGLVVPAAVRFEGKELDKELVYDKVFVGLGANDAIFELPKGQ